MSVFTTVTSQALTSFLESYQIGEGVGLHGIKEGIENTNYFLTTTSGEYVLTVFETLDFDEVPYCMALMHYFSGHGVACADPVASVDGCYVNVLMGKPASIVSKLPGKSVEVASKKQLGEVARALGILHRTSLDFKTHRECRFDHRWREITAQIVMEDLEPEDRELLQTEMHAQSLYRFKDLPIGIIHSDLFRDNVLFVNDELTGVIDFYDACTGPFLYDIAVVVNEWCRKKNGAIDTEKTCEFLKAYNIQRPLNTLEKDAWPMMLRRAALRFWLSRLQAKFNPRKGQMAFQKNPKEFHNILINAVNEQSILVDLWLS